jgi:hypothetical protein
MHRMTAMTSDQGSKISQWPQICAGHQVDAQERDPHASASRSENTMQNTFILCRALRLHAQALRLTVAFRIPARSWTINAHNFEKAAFMAPLRYGNGHRQCFSIYLDETSIKVTGTSFGLDTPDRKRRYINVCCDHYLATGISNSRTQNAHSDSKGVMKTDDEVGIFICHSARPQFPIHIPGNDNLTMSIFNGISLIGQLCEGSIFQRFSSGSAIDYLGQ